MNCFYLKRYGLKAKGFLTQSPPFFCREEASQNGIFRKLRTNFVVGDYFKNIGKKKPHVNLLDFMPLLQILVGLHQCIAKKCLCYARTFLHA